MNNCFGYGPPDESVIDIYEAVVARILEHDRLLEHRAVELARISAMVIMGTKKGDIVDLYNELPGEMFELRFPYIATLKRSAVDSVKQEFMRAVGVETEEEFKTYADKFKSMVDRSRLQTAQEIEIEAQTFEKVRKRLAAVGNDRRRV